MPDFGNRKTSAFEKMRRKLMKDPTFRVEYGVRVVFSQWRQKHRWFRKLPHWAQNRIETIKIKRITKQMEELRDD